jgi:hypothetical protein
MRAKLGMLLAGVAAGSAAAETVLILAAGATDATVYTMDWDALTIGAVHSRTTIDATDLAWSPSGDLYLSRIGGLDRYDGASGAWVNELLPQNVGGPWISGRGFGGLDFRDTGEAVFSINGFPFPAGSVTNWLASFDLATQTNAGTVRLDPSFRYYAMDVRLRSDGTALLLNYRDSEVWTVDPATGDAAVFALSANPTSFLEIGGELFILSQGGMVHRFDEWTGQSAFYGQIDGLSGPLLGSALAVPSPGAVPVLIGLGMLGRRRRG